MQPQIDTTKIDEAFIEAISKEDNYRKMLSDNISIIDEFIDNKKRKDQESLEKLVSPYKKIRGAGITFDSVKAKLEEGKYEEAAIAVVEALMEHLEKLEIQEAYAQIAIQMEEFNSSFKTVTGLKNIKDDKISATDFSIISTQQMLRYKLLIEAIGKELKKISGKEEIPVIDEMLDFLTTISKKIDELKGEYIAQTDLAKMFTKKQYGDITDAFKGVKISRKWPFNDKKKLEKASKEIAQTIKSEKSVTEIHNILSEHGFELDEAAAEKIKQNWLENKYYKKMDNEIKKEIENAMGSLTSIRVKNPNSSNKIISVLTGKNPTTQIVQQLNRAYNKRETKKVKIYLEKLGIPKDKATTIAEKIQRKKRLADIIIAPKKPEPKHIRPHEPPKQTKTEQSTKKQSGELIEELKEKLATPTIH